MSHVFSPPKTLILQVWGSSLPKAKQYLHAVRIFEPIFEVVDLSQKLD